MHHARSLADHQPHDAQEVRWVQVSPELAKEWLKKNRANFRRLMQRTMEGYATDMLAGRWMRNPADAICFGMDGTLLNGQHRLAAVAKSGVTITFLVAFGVDPAAMDVMDGGKRRTAADTLRRSAVFSDPASAQASARWLLSVREVGLPGACTRFGGGAISFTNARVVECALAHRLEIEFAIVYCATKGSWLARRPSLRALRLIASRSFRDEAEEFSSGLANGDGLVSGSPILLLRERLTNERSRYVGGNRKATVDSAVEYGLTFRAWNAYLNGERMAKLQVPSVIPTPIGFESWDFGK